MQVVILAGGLGTRLKDIAGSLPKAMVPVAGQPFIAHQFELLKRHGLTEVLMCIGYGADALKDYLGDGSSMGMKVSYSEEDPDALLGTGGALIHALPGLAETFMVMYGDSYLPINYSAVAGVFEKSERDGLMTVFRNQGQWDASNVRVEGDRVVFYSKSAKPGEADYIDYGLSCLRRDVIEGYSECELPLDLAVVLGDLVERAALIAYEVEERFYEIGKPEGLAELDAYLRKQ
jgi:NDP-sugar pyrophosphorylase family protein